MTLSVLEHQRNLVLRSAEPEMGHPRSFEIADRNRGESAAACAPWENINLPIQRAAPSNLALKLSNRRRRAQG
jgi:hypothetical protein